MQEEERQECPEQQETTEKSDQRLHRFKESYEGEKPPGRKPGRPQFEPVDSGDSGSTQQGQDAGTEQD